MQMKTIPVASQSGRHLKLHHKKEKKKKEEEEARASSHDSVF